MNYSDGVVRRAVRVWLGWRQQINSKQKQTKTKKCDHEKGYIKAGVYKNMALPLMKVISDAWMGNWEENELGSIRTQHRHGHTHKDRVHSTVLLGRGGEIKEKFSSTEVETKLRVAGSV